MQSDACKAACFSASTLLRQTGCSDDAHAGCRRCQLGSCFGYRTAGSAALPLPAAHANVRSAASKLHVDGQGAAVQVRLQKHKLRACTWALALAAFKTGQLARQQLLRPWRR